MKNHREFALAGVRMKQHLSHDETGGSLSLFENSSNGATGTPIHVHTHEDETLYVLEGTMRALIDRHEQLVGAGEAVFLPRGVPHQLLNASDSPAHYLLLCTPGGFERFLQDAGQVIRPDDPIGAATDEDIKRLKAAAPRFGVTLLPDWPPQKI